VNSVDIPQSDLSYLSPFLTPFKYLKYFSIYDR
jgi:hypothetical protein